MVGQPGVCLGTSLRGSHMPPCARRGGAIPFGSRMTSFRLSVQRALPGIPIHNVQEQKTDMERGGGIARGNRFSMRTSNHRWPTLQDRILGYEIWRSGIWESVEI